jgi:chemotaxis protein CheD
MGSPSLNDITTFERKIIIGVGGYAVSANRGAFLTTYSLGSCLGITIYDPVVRVGGLLHVMLPDSSINEEKAREQPGMFVDTGIPQLFKDSYKLGAVKNRVHICVAGGAQFLDKTGYFNIGQRNVEQLTALLDKHGLTVDAMEVGGLVSRTVQLNMDSGEVRLKSSGQTTETILFKA